MRRHDRAASCRPARAPSRSKRLFDARLAEGGDPGSLSARRSATSRRRSTCSSPTRATNARAASGRLRRAAATSRARSSSISSAESQRKPFPEVRLRDHLIADTLGGGALAALRARGPLDPGAGGAWLARVRLAPSRHPGTAVAREGAPSVGRRRARSGRARVSGGHRQGRPRPRGDARVAGCTSAPRARSLGNKSGALAAFRVALFIDDDFTRAAGGRQESDRGGRARRGDNRVAWARCISSLNVPDGGAVG